MGDERVGEEKGGRGFRGLGSLKVNFLVNICFFEFVGFYLFRWIW